MFVSCPSSPISGAYIGDGGRDGRSPRVSSDGSQQPGLVSDARLLCCTPLQELACMRLT
jgi:hypothetical protein